jgi:hypothetical protein
VVRCEQHSSGNSPLARLIPASIRADLLLLEHGWAFAHPVGVNRIRLLSFK